MTLMRQIEGGIEQGKVKAHLVRKALKDTDINIRGLGYAVLSEDHMRALLVDFKPKADDVQACFDYLIDCIAADLDWDEDYAHCREDAAFELGGVLDPYWDNNGVGLDPSVFWERTTDVMRGLGERDVIAFLEGCPKDAAFEEAMTGWRNDPELRDRVPT